MALVFGQRKGLYLRKVPTSWTFFPSLIKINNQGKMKNIEQGNIKRAPVGFEPTISFDSHHDSDNLNLKMNALTTRPRCISFLFFIIVENN